jgi:hypothetical protein
MASSDTGTYWENLGYIGELYTASPKQTPFLSAIGTLSSGGKVTDNFEFPVSDEYSLTAAAQTAITEDNIDSAPVFADHAITQRKNVCEIHYLGVKASYAALATKGRISGVATAGEPMSIDDLIDHKIMIRLAEIARNVEYAFLQGTYAISTDADVANATRGLIECASDASNTIAAGSKTLSKDLIQELVRTMYGHGAQFIDPVFIVNAFQAQQISNIYGYAPADRTIGGVSIKQVLEDVIGNIGVMLDPHQPAATLTIADLGACSPVFQQVPGHAPGVFYEELARDSASVKGMLYGHVGLDHGPYWMHGTITSLATS